MSAPKWLRTQMSSETEAAPIRSTQPAYLDPNKTRVAKSKAHETRVAADYGGRRLAASGALPFSNRDKNTAAADVVTADLLIQHKGTERDSMGLKRDWLHDLIIEARKRSKQPALIITFDEETRVENEWVMLPRSVFKRLMANQPGDE